MNLCCGHQVQEAVHGVTLDECRAALQSHSWSVAEAINHLKVPLIHQPFITQLALKQVSTWQHALITTLIFKCKLTYNINK